MKQFKPMTRFKALRLLCLLWNDYENITVTHWNGRKPSGWSSTTMLKKKDVE